MQIIKSFFKLALFVLPFTASAQSSFLPQDDKAEHFLDRIDIKQQSNYGLILSINKPLSRKLAVDEALQADSLNKLHPADPAYSLSPVDRYNLNSARIDNVEWLNGDTTGANSKKLFLNTFYKQKANLYEANEKDFFLAVNPVIQETQSYESGNNQRLFLNTKGVTLRGMIGSLGFSAYLTDNQERGPGYFQQMVTASGYAAVPGAGYYKAFKGTGFDYFDNRASIYFKAWKYFDFQFGYDKNFIGDGYRSLFLSDNSAPYLFLKFSTRIWKLNYETIYMQLVSQHQPSDSVGDYQYPEKYAVIHHLSVNVVPWLNVGLFENVTFSRANHFDFTYLNPVIFLVAAQQENGSPDKTTAGLDFKANIAHKFQVYGQLLFNEFVLDQLLHYSRGWWANKQGLQLGVKYIDAFKVKNLDLQLEGNIVRPFTYSHDDSVSNYSNYNQPLADPLGANFDELIAIVRYQPINKLNLEGKIIYYRQGLDSGGINYGSNIFLNYTTRSMDYGYKVGSGMLATCLNASVTASYELRENLFFDLSLQYRTYKVAANTSMDNDSKMITVGFRLNAFKRLYDY
jgi:hypothetical protein